MSAGATRGTDIKGKNEPDLWPLIVNEGKLTDCGESQPPHRAEIAVGNVGETFSNGVERFVGDIRSGVSVGGIRRGRDEGAS